MSQVLVVPTGTANLASILAGLERAGRKARVSADADQVAAARQVVLPGVGSLGAAMLELTKSGLADALRTRIHEDHATLAVCVGLQLLLDGSEESPGIPALGALSGTACRFPGSVRVPQLGWNRVVPEAGCRLVEPGWAYFANSYRLVDAPAGYRAAWADHGGRFVAALERGNLLACQFHPELSGQWGQALIRRWLQGDGLQGDGGGSC